MFSQLQTIFATLIDASKLLRNLGTARERRRVVLALLTAYLVLKNIINRGNRALQILNDYTNDDLDDLTPQKARALTELLHVVIEQQLFDLEQLNHLLQNASILDLLCPNLRATIARQIGWKDQALLGIAAEMYFYHAGFFISTVSVDSISKVIEHQFDLIRPMFPHVRDTGRINLSASRQLLGELRKTMESLRSATSKAVPQEDFLILSRKAEAFACHASLQKLGRVFPSKLYEVKNG